MRSICRYLFFACILSFAAAAISRAEGPLPRLKLLNECLPSWPECVEMEFNLDPRSSHPWLRTLPSFLISRGKPQRAWYDGQIYFHEFVWRVEGRQNHERPRTFALLYHDRVAGTPLCPSVFQDTIAVIGFSPGGRPIVLTDGGELELSDDKLLPGSWSAALLINKRTGRAYPLLTPKFELGGYALSFSPSGNIYVDSEKSCVLLNPRGRFRAVAKRHCDSKWSIGNALSDQQPDKAPTSSTNSEAAMTRFRTALPKHLRTFYDHGFFSVIEWSDLDFDVAFHHLACT